MRRTVLASLALAVSIACLSSPIAAQQQPEVKPQDEGPSRAIRNAPSPRALQFAAYIYSASNVCGYRIGTDAFKDLLAKQNVTPEDVGPRGPFANRLTGMFTLMSNQMAQNREQACLAVASEYGPEGSIARDVLLPLQSGEGIQVNPSTERSAPVKPAQ